MCSLFPKAVVIDFIPIIVFILFQGEEFNVYEKYVDDMLAPRGKERLNTLLQRPDISNTLQVSFNLPAHFSSYFQIRVVFVIDKPWLLSRFWVYCKLYHSLVTFHCLTPNEAEPSLGQSERSPNYDIIYSIPKTETITWFICFNQCMGLFLLFFFLTKTILLFI